jgi:serine protease AprX
MAVNPQQLERALFLGRGVERFTQDSPVLPDVWMEYGAKPTRQIDLLLNPYKDGAPGKLCDILIARLEDPSTRQREQHENDPQRNREGREAAYNQSTIAVRLYFDELIQVALPMTNWWNVNVRKDGGNDLKDFLDDKERGIDNKENRKKLAEFMKKYPLREAEGNSRSQPSSMDDRELPFTSPIIWIIRVVGAIAFAMKQEREEEEKNKIRASRRGRSRGVSIDGNEEEIVEAAAELLGGCREVVGKDLKMVKQDPTGPRTSGERELNATERTLLWSINLNRPAKSTIYISTASVKADAARLLFDVSCKHLCWAVIDSGIDARHTALQRRPPEASPVREIVRKQDAAAAAEKGAQNGDEQNPKESQKNDQPLPWTETTRVIATYDFTIIRKLLNREKTWDKQLPDELREFFGRRDDKKKEFEKRLREGRSVDWDYLLPFLAIPYIDSPEGLKSEPPAPEKVGPNDDSREGSLESAASEQEESKSDADESRDQTPADAEESGIEDTPIRYYRPPKHNHGTHVAGIIGADWRKDDEDNPLGFDLKGICPDIRLYDLRVLGDDGTGDEFSLIAAMQFVRHLNAHKEMRVIHGVNLSICIKHNVRNFACGCTPVCEESERMVNSGLVVVAAAGNDGYLHYMTSGGRDYEGYNTISITDPGNAEAVITVGSTHRERAHAYGVSFFSSRGPTGDGRQKPDLVAPGEKIVSLIPGYYYDVMDGTSMATPHVSGAAALLLARYQELIGRPTRVKQILCKTATDLGRERYFQGNGMVDVLRAMQAI